ncbi:MAG: hypothetical protein KH828_01280 [Clostridiales bacterium]|nr:hypothetical protein [Clostridiales bacterium]
MAQQINDMTEKDSSKQHIRKKPKHIRLFIVFLFLCLAGSAYFYYALVYRVSHEPAAPSDRTLSEPLYSLRTSRTLLSLTPEVKSAAFNGRAAEIDYGTYVVPGLLATQTQVFGQKGTSDICTSMTPQGLAVTEDYLLVSSYCRSGTHNSVIYVIDKKTHQFVKELVLRNKSHVGGLAYDPLHQNIWVSGMSQGIPQVNAISLKELEKYSFQKEYLPIVYSQSYDLYAITRTSFLTYHDKALYVGYFTQDTASVLEKYDIMDNGTLVTESVSTAPSLTDPLTPIALPSDMRVITEQAQGVAFYKNKILFSHSYGIYPSTLQVFNNSLQKLLEENAVVKSIRFPEKMEQIYVDGDDLYVLFESAAYSYRASSLIKLDRILKLNLKTLLS